MSNITGFDRFKGEEVFTIIHNKFSIPPEAVAPFLEQLIGLFPTRFDHEVSVRRSGAFLPEGSALYRALHKGPETLEHVEARHVIDVLLHQTEIPNEAWDLLSAQSIVELQPNYGGNAPTILVPIRQMVSEPINLGYLLDALSRQEGVPFYKLDLSKGFGSVEPIDIALHNRSSMVGAALATTTDFKSCFDLACQLIRSPDSNVVKAKGTLLDVRGDVYIFYSLFPYEQDRKLKIALRLREIIPTFAAEEPLNLDMDDFGEGGYSNLFTGEAYGSKKKRFRMLEALVNSLIEARVDQLICSHHLTHDLQELTFNLHRTSRSVLSDMRKVMWCDDFKESASF